MAIALCAIVLVTGRALFSRIDAAAATELGHEAEKFRSFAQGDDPATGAPFADARTLLTSHLAHNLPETEESFFSIVDGHADRRSSGDPPARLDADRAFVADLATAQAPRWGRTETDAGAALYAVLPVRFEGQAQRGALVAVEFLAPAQAEAWSTVLTMSAAGVAALLLAAGAGWLVAGRALTPIREVQHTAALIGGGDDLGRRIDVVGSDDVAQLALTFNGMLDRVQAAFDGQRRFLDDAGHELRTPITVVRGHLDVMGDDPGEREETLRLVDDELRRMSRLVDDLILLARSERPGFLVMARVELTDLVVDTLAKASAIADRRWAIDAVPEGVILADGQRLAQALLQLAQNAVSHTTAGQTIAVGGDVRDGRVRLWVRDAGTGIDPEEQSLIFERFARGPGAPRTRGSGLGLAIVARIAQAHGGRVSVDSAPGAGSTFTLDLPQHAEETS
ncbi:HAMP domain-containing histidine kinase [Microbacterium sp. KUDC0406]|uniref:sensor histidine kinase n=1 Tax=Microbacterium sp. KUDC0406 TaxID=2909588 RepID=UPI001F399AF2|nr:HAMP domain-containing sensor histidine kinase [Microbacterium sp. KUDC0406]UJP10823.1 HAMP domain-containing histidine kinase [Microbacterium sp. KUDC0406]